MKSVRIVSYSGPHFPSFRLNNSEHGHFSRNSYLQVNKILNGVSLAFEIAEKLSKIKITSFDYFLLLLIHS